MAPVAIRSCFAFMLVLSCSGAYCAELQNGSAQTWPDAVPDLNSNRIVWREGAQGAYTWVGGAIEYKVLRYNGRTIHSHVMLWGSQIRASVGVKNESDNTYTLDMAADIAIQLTGPKRDLLRPLETEQIARILEKQGKYNKLIAQDLRKKPSKLGPVTIPAKSDWTQVFYFAYRDPFDERFYRGVDFLVTFGDVAFVFPYEL